MRTRREINSAEWFGEVPDGWNMVPLPRLFMSSKGMTVTRADLVDEGAPVVNYAQVHSKLNNRFGIHEELFLVLGVWIAYRIGYGWLRLGRHEALPL